MRDDELAQLCNDLCAVGMLLESNLFDVGVGPEHTEIVADARVGYARAVELIRSAQARFGSSSPRFELALTVTPTGLAGCWRAQVTGRGCAPYQAIVCEGGLVDAVIHALDEAASSMLSSTVSNVDVVLVESGGFVAKMSYGDFRLVLGSPRAEQFIIDVLAR